MHRKVKRRITSQDLKTLTRHYDTFGRNVGYSVDGDRKQSIVYSPSTGRIAESDGFKWDYLANSNLKSKLTYPSGATASWDYEANRDLLTKVTNAHANGTEISSYTYTNDLLGRRTSKNNEQYGYNVRDELISANNVSYNYDDIGNRTTAEGKAYTANNLNQYTAIDDFTPQYDADGNQTLIKTESGIWSVQYNAENRPVRWQSGDTVITMSFDRMGRRVEMRTQSAASGLLQRFVYDNYLCIQQLRTPSNTLFHSYVWDPTEPLATRPLIFLPASGVLSYYFHDGNKNVSDFVDIHGSVAHYDYTPFGVPMASSPSENPYRFSSEYFNETLGLTYYNYRHYQPNNGRWCSKDPIGELDGVNLFSFVSNSPFQFDWLGLLKKQIPFQDGERDIVLGKIPMLPGSGVRHRVPNNYIAEVEYVTWGKCLCKNGKRVVRAGINVVDRRFLSDNGNGRGLGISAGPVGVSINVDQVIDGSGSEIEVVINEDGSVLGTSIHKINIVKTSNVILGFSFGGGSVDRSISEKSTILATDEISYTHRCAKEDFK